MLSTAAFDPETLQILRQALDEAAEALPKSERTQEHKVLLASCILALAAAGERDPVRLRAGAILQVFPTRLGNTAGNPTPGFALQLGDR